MVPDAFPQAARAKLLHPDVMIPPLLWLASPAADDVTGARFVASRWRRDVPVAEAVAAAREMTGWPE
jgi:3-oxoacyl-[acyl-carrier protein] reductase